MSLTAGFKPSFGRHGPAIERRCSSLWRWPFSSVWSGCSANAHPVDQGRVSRLALVDEPPGRHQLPGRLVGTRSSSSWCQLRTTWIWDPTRMGATEKCFLERKRPAAIVRQPSGLSQCKKPFAPQGEKPGAGADIRNDIALFDPEEIEEFLRLLAFDPFRPVKPPGIPRIDQLGLALDAERARPCHISSRQQEK